MTDQESAATGELVADWTRWRRERDAELTEPHGFLSITGLHWLTEESQRFDDAPGAWANGDDGVVVVLRDGEELVVDGVPVRDEHRFGPVSLRGVRAAWGDALIEVAGRGGQVIVRPHHPDNPPRLSYRGTPTYPPDPRWVVSGRYLPFDRPRPTTVNTVVDGLTHTVDAPGEVAFELAGQRLRLTVFGDGDGGIGALFRDATSGVTTYGAGRDLVVGRPAADGTVIVDFNRASNPPCAYTDLATCPLPPAENRLPVRIEAGEKTPTS